MEVEEKSAQRLNSPREGLEKGGTYILTYGEIFVIPFDPSRGSLSRVPTARRVHLGDDGEEVKLSVIGYMSVPIRIPWLRPFIDTGVVVEIDGMEKVWMLPTSAVDGATFEAVTPEDVVLEP